MQSRTNLFDTVARAITSLGAVICVMLLVITGMIFFSHTLFNGVFPATMSSWEKAGATWVLALGWELTVLITTCNTRHISKQIPILMAVCSGVIVLFFIEAFDFQESALHLVQRWFVGGVVATINYIYAELFYAKWMERKAEITEPSRVIELESTVTGLQSKLDETILSLNESESTQKELASKLNEAQNQVNQLLQLKYQIQQELKCPHCEEGFSSYGSLHAHKGHCAQNPKRINRSNTSLRPS